MEVKMSIESQDKKTVSKTDEKKEVNRVPVPAPKKVAPGRIVYNSHLGNYRCIDNKTNKRVLTCNTLAGARQSFPDYEVTDK